MNIQECTEAIRTKVGDDSGLNAVLKFDCGADGQIVIDGAAAPNTVDNNDRDADCTVAITLENLNNLLTGKLDPVIGFMGGKFKVSRSAGRSHGGGAPGAGRSFFGRQGL